MSTFFTKLYALWWQKQVGFYQYIIFNSKYMIIYITSWTFVYIELTNVDEKGKLKKDIKLIIL